VEEIQAMELNDDGSPMSRRASCPHCGCSERILADESWECPSGCMEDACPECGYRDTSSNASGDKWCENCGWEEEEEGKGEDI
jgi:hypothetical protein